PGFGCVMRAEFNDCPEVGNHRTAGFRIKHALARGAPNDMPISGQEALGYFRDAGFALLDISPKHAAGVETLPPLHADPFDRLLIAQALMTPLRLLTHDARVAAYSDLTIAV